MFDELHGRTIVVFGELHGTAEAPMFVAAAVAAAASRGPVLLGLEWPDALQPAVDAFLAGGDRAALVATPHELWAWRDGRSSAAMLELLEHARALRVRVVCFDGVFASGEDRDAGMARSLLAAIDPAATTIALCGNAHAQTSSPRWMGWHLRQAYPDLIALDIRHTDGTAWCCLDPERPAGIEPMRAMPGQIERGLHIYTERDAAGFDGEYALGPITASLPIA